MSLVIPLDSQLEESSNSSLAPRDLLTHLLQEQQVTAVDRFADWHAREIDPLQARHYRDLIPLAAPRDGEQYAFEVELDACSGCKACVVACHNLNGLEADETWRSVGLLHGGSTALPVLQHVTAACHHCVEPACLEGCPVEAYEKDPVTGIVRHLDDQCIGCQYCILKCPYDVPKYSSAKGIVRKCDMCAGRLAAGEAPACVQACPSRAIRVTIVNREEIAENAEANLFLPGAPEPGYTLPTTVYKSRRPLPSNLLPADYYTASPQHAHWPLVLMLVLTQMSVGAFLVDQVLNRMVLASGVVQTSDMRALHLGTVLLLGLLGLAASTFHLGRPWLAYRAVIAWRTSWLSREVLAFGAFAASTILYAALAGLRAAGFPLAESWEQLVAAAVIVSGVAGVACSTMIYSSTRRAFWNPAYTAIKFLLTCLILGIPVALLMHLLASWSAPHYFALVTHSILPQLCLLLLAITAAKLAVEATIFAWLSARTFRPLRRTACLMTGDLARSTSWRFALGIVGGIVLPGLLPALSGQTSSSSASLTMVIVAVCLAVNFVGELLERYLFFAAVVAPKMPGAPHS